MERRRLRPVILNAELRKVGRRTAIVGTAPGGAPGARGKD
jgi:hypothetical protein